MAKHKVETAQDGAGTGTAVAETPAAAVKSEATTRPAIGSPQFNELTAAERTQIIADERYDGPQVFECGHHDCPTIRVKAHDEGQAKFRFRELCGIINSDHQTTAQAV